MTAESGRYVGGPLDGQPARPFRGRWSTWRDNEGKHVPTPEGDKRYLGHDHHGYPPFYSCLTEDGVYLHSSFLAARGRARLGLDAQPATTDHRQNGAA